MSLHDQIMNLPAEIPERLGTEGDKYRSFERAAFLDGHKAARHQAAELVAGLEAELELAIKALERVEWGLLEGLEHLSSIAGRSRLLRKRKE
jgi:phage gp37-like protein